MSLLRKGRSKRTSICQNFLFDVLSEKCLSVMEKFQSNLSNEILWSLLNKEWMGFFVCSNLVRIFRRGAGQ